MHRSRLAGFIIDCPTTDLESAAGFWSSALGMAPQPLEGDRYVPLDSSARDLVIEVQRVDHPARLHLDIQTDNLPAEVRRLERLGARAVGMVRTFMVMESPTGQRFCIVNARDLTNAAGVNVWDDE